MRMTCGERSSDTSRSSGRIPLDVACIGIGENGHIAFNDPPVADFDDPLLVKEVELDDACRLQQVHDGWFSSFRRDPAARRSP